LSAPGLFLKPAHRSAPTPAIFDPLRSVFRFAHAPLTCFALDVSVRPSRRDRDLYVSRSVSSPTDRQTSVSDLWVSCTCQETRMTFNIHIAHMLCSRVVLDQRLTFSKHVSAVARSCNYHAQAVRHIRHLLTTDLAQTLACSLILSWIDY